MNDQKTVQARTLMTSMKHTAILLDQYLFNARMCRRLFRENKRRLLLIAEDLPANSILRIEIVSFLNRKR